MMIFTKKEELCLNLSQVMNEKFGGKNTVEIKKI